jgi:hypothetical protein
VNASTANDCYGSSTSNTGLSATVANNCYGISVSGDGVYVSETANNCHGQSTGGQYGLSYPVSATNCSGYNANTASYAIGLLALNASSCYGYANGGGNGLNVQIVAIGCTGYTNGSGLGLFENGIANSCWGTHTVNNTTTTSESVNLKYNMP